MPKMPDLSKFNIEELKTIIRDAETAIDRKSADAFKAAREAVEEVAREHGYKLADILGGSRPATSKGAKTPVPPKYRNPDTPDETWSGRGRQPSWFKEAIEKGTSREDMEI